MKKNVSILIALLLASSMFLAACGEKKPAEEVATPDVVAEEPAEEPTEEPAEEPAGDEEEEELDDNEMEEWPLEDDKEPFENGEIEIAGVYFQPVDMEPAGNSLAKEDADAHIEADIKALRTNTLGFGDGEFVPYLKVTATFQKEGSDKIDEVVFMPMNAKDGLHYGTNYKFQEGLGKYKIKFIVENPGNEHLLHVDEATGVEGRFWNEPIEVDFDFEWKGPQW